MTMHVYEMSFKLILNVSHLGWVQKRVCTKPVEAIFAVRAGINSVYTRTIETILGFCNTRAQIFENVQKP